MNFHHSLEYLSLRVVVVAVLLISLCELVSGYWNNQKIFFFQNKCPESKGYNESGKQSLRCYFTSAILSEPWYSGCFANWIWFPWDFHRFPLIMPIYNTQIMEHSFLMGSWMCQFWKSWEDWKRQQKNGSEKQGRAEIQKLHTRKHIFCFVRSDLGCGTEEISMKWQKVFITQAARRQHWKDQSPLQGYSCPQST